MRISILVPYVKKLHLGQLIDRFRFDRRQRDLLAQRHISIKLPLYVTLRVAQVVVLLKVVQL